MILKIFKITFLKIFKLIFKLLKIYNQLFIGILLGLAVVYFGNAGLQYTSTDEFCGICHIHPHVTYSWKKSTHYKNKSGVVVHCVECHLPPGGLHYFTEKAKLGIVDIYSAIFKDKEKINWEVKSTREYAVKYSYDESCLKCHQDLYSLELSPEGVEAHEYYLKSPEKLYCINCHITVGHYHEKPVEEVDYLAEEEIPERPDRPLDVDEFVDYRQTIPGTDVTFDMIAIHSGTFTMGSPETEPYHRTDEEPPRRVQINPFWMGEIEVSWREYDVFFARTATRGKNEQDLPSFEGTKDEEKYISATDVDAITGPTPPYGAPDQGWGKGLRPAITMTHHAAVTYCKWLSTVTGKNFRLPTEAEWEYACSAGTTGPYYFEGDPEKLTRKSRINRWFRKNTAAVDSFAWSMTNSNWKTYPPFINKPNPWGLYNMLGNVKEFCNDWYSSDTYSLYPADSVVNPTGPDSGKEHVIRGGSYKSDPADLRSAHRNHTLHDRWLVTDPQSPKSIWWYSDCMDVGFRVVREYEGEITGSK